MDIATLVVGGGLAVLVLAVLTTVFSRFHRPPPNHISLVGAQSASQSTSQPLCICMGDSNTFGRIAVSYPDLLSGRFDGRLQVVNAGKNSGLTYHMYAFLDALEALQPSYVTIAIGTNDVNLKLSPVVERAFRLLGKIPELPTRESYVRNVSTLIAELRRRCSAQIAMLSIPVLSEEVDGEANELVASYNKLLQELAIEKGCAYLPLFERQMEVLRARAIPPRSHYKDLNRLVAKTLVAHFMLGKPLDVLADENGLLCLVDCIHLNGKSAGIAADLIEGWLNSTRQLED